MAGCVDACGVLTTSRLGALRVRTPIMPAMGRKPSARRAVGEFGGRVRPCIEVRQPDRPDRLTSSVGPAGFVSLNAGPGEQAGAVAEAAARAAAAESEVVARRPKIDPPSP